MKYEIELERNNVTPAKFLAEIRFACKKKGITFELDLDQFVNPIQQSDSSYFLKDGKKIGHNGSWNYEASAEDAACKAEVCRILPYDYQIFISRFDGSCFNEICEFTFYDDKRGHGYYYRLEKD